MTVSRRHLRATIATLRCYHPQSYALALAAAYAQVAPDVLGDEEARAELVLLAACEPTATPLLRQVARACGLSWPANRPCYAPIPQEPVTDYDRAAGERAVGRMR
jgi:hypothetical protein